MGQGEHGESNLTERQQRIWLEQQLAPEVPANNMVTSFRINAAVDPERFQQAFSSVVQGNEALRTVFESIDGWARQRVVAQLDVRIEFLDFSDAPDPEAVFRPWFNLRRQRALRLETQAWDSVLIRLGPSDFVWYLCLHHLITDSWSCAILYRRTLEAYQGSRGEPGPGFSEYLEHTARRRQTREQLDSEVFWKQRLERPREPVRFYARALTARSPYFERRSLQLDSRRMQRLLAVCGVEPGAPGADQAIATFLMALVFAYVHRASGNRLLGLGSPVLNRPSRRFREAMGCFMEVCPLQMEVEPGDSFANLVSKVRRELFAILPHSRACPGNTTRSRAFEVMFNYHKGHFAPLLGPTHTEFLTGTTVLDGKWPAAQKSAGLEYETLVVTADDFDRTGRLTLSLDFNVGVFDSSACDVAMGHFLRLLDASLADPNQRIERVALLSGPERRQILVDFNHTRRDRPAGRTVVDLFDEQARSNPDKVAVAFEDQALSYGELQDQVNQLARRLRAHHIVPERRVAIFMDRGPQMVVALLATMKAGGAYVPLDPAYPPVRLQQILEDARPAVVLTTRALRPSLPDAPGAAVMEQDAPDQFAKDDGPVTRIAPLPEDRLAYIIFTSGSTGRPKGVEITHRALTNFLLSMAHNPGVGREDTVLALTTISFDIAALELFLPLSVGATVFMIDRATAADGLALTTVLERSSITVMQATPASWRMLVDSGWKGDPGLRILTGGEALAPDLARALLARGKSVFNLYGPTETTVWSTVHRVSDADGDSIPIGRPIDNTTVYVLDGEALPLPVGVIGELYIGGDGVARGYHGRRDLTAERFLPDPFKAGGEGRMYRTGDLACFAADGTLAYHGRADRQIKLRGFRIEPAEIEAALRAHPAIRDAAVVVRPVGAAADPRLCGYVTARSQTLPGASELRAFLGERLPDYMIPAHVVPLPALPRTPNGKTDLAALPAPEPTAEAAADDGPAFVAPQGELEVMVAAQFAQLLGAGRVGRQDDFFALGGHSLLAVRLLGHIRGRFGVEISAGAFFAEPTVQAVAARLQQRAPGGSDSLLVPLQGKGSRPPVFFICGLQIYQALANRLGPNQPSYGVFIPAEERLLSALNPGANPAADASIPRVEEMAREYVEVIRSQQPHGPYQLAGLSFGGVLAFEVAQVLHAAGEQVNRLVLFDTLMSGASRRSLPHWVWTRLRALARGQLPGPWRRGRKSPGPAPAPTAAGGPQTASRSEDEMGRLREGIFLKASARYAPRSYPGSILLFRALDRIHQETDDGWRCDAANGWGPFAAGPLQIVDVPGHHLDMMSEPVVDLVAARMREVFETGTQPLLMPVAVDRPQRVSALGPVPAVALVKRAPDRLQAPAAAGPSVPTRHAGP